MNEWCGGLLILGFVLSGCSSPPSDNSAFQTVVEDHLKQYPASELEDWYKLAHQAAMGNLHLGVDFEHVTDYLIEEWTQVHPDTNQPLTSPLSPDSTLIRFHLAPFKACQGELALLEGAMLGTRTQWSPSEVLIAQYLDALIPLHTQLNLTSSTMRSFFQEKKEEGYPAIHHSTGYAETYHPSYRVILRELAPRCP